MVTCWGRKDVPRRPRKCKQVESSNDNAPVGRLVHLVRVSPVRGVAAPNLDRLMTLRFQIETESLLVEAESKWSPAPEVVLNACGLIVHFRGPPRATCTTNSWPLSRYPAIQARHRSKGSVGRCRYPAKHHQFPETPKSMVMAQNVRIFLSQRSSSRNSRDEPQVRGWFWIIPLEAETGTFTHQVESISRLKGVTFGCYSISSDTLTLRQIVQFHLCIFFCV